MPTTTIVTPSNDSILHHFQGTNCPCQPELTSYPNGNVVIVHNNQISVSEVESWKVFTYDIDDPPVVQIEYSL